MTVEEIKQAVTMPSLLAERGIPVKRNMCKCPFHGEDKHPSMRVYRDGFKCFACGESGDVISFVMKYEGIDFKAAYKALGGSYEHKNDHKERIAIKRKFERQQAQKMNEAAADRELRTALVDALEICRVGCEVYEPMSDQWCELKNALPVLDYYMVLLNSGEEINKIDVFRKCRELKQKFLP